MERIPQLLPRVAGASPPVGWVPVGWVWTQLPQEGMAPQHRSPGKGWVRTQPTGLLPRCANDDAKNPGSGRHFVPRRRWPERFRPARQAAEPGARSPRLPPPGAGAKDVPLRTSLYLHLGLPPEAKKGDAMDAASVAVSLQPQGGETVALLKPGRQFAAGASGWLRPHQGLLGGSALAVYIDRDAPLRPETTYTVHVEARSVAGADLEPKDRDGWTFTTEAAPKTHALSFAVDLATEPVAWHGRFFSGPCNVIFCSEAATLRPDLRPDGRGPQAPSPGLELSARLLDDRHRVPPPVVPSVNACPTSSASARRAGSPRSSREETPSCSASRTSSATTSTASRPAGPSPRTTTRATRS